MNQPALQAQIQEASKILAKTWPLYSFVTANPLSGYEHLCFLDAVKEAEGRLATDLLPSAAMLKDAWQEKKISEAALTKLLLKADLNESPEHYLSLLEAAQPIEEINPYHELDRLCAKWLSLFLDEGLAPWPMPFKEMGFYTAWRKLIVFDKDIYNSKHQKIPRTPIEALDKVLAGYSKEDQLEIFKQHLLALPGWAGYIKYRKEHNTIWNKEYPVSLLDYLAVRLWMASKIKAPLLAVTATQKDQFLTDLKYLWLEAWEASWQSDCDARLQNSMANPIATSRSLPQAQLVFCLDTRSELLRRTLEQTGDYETFGAAGAFGITMDYQHPETKLTVKSSPAMATSLYVVEEHAQIDQLAAVKAYKSKWQENGGYTYFLKRLKNILPSAFGFVEGSGIYYGLLILMRLFFPNAAQRLSLKHHPAYEDIYNPHLYKIGPNQTKEEVDIVEKAAILKGLLDSCGWSAFAPIIILTGHGSHSTNNPFASSLDCGACAGHPGKRNARMMATIANDKAVRQALEDQYDIKIPEETIFVAAEHITSTDEVTLFDSQVPAAYKERLEQIKADLLKVKHQMTTIRLNESTKAADLAKVKSNSWSESRPEWGLSGHAGYIIGPRSLTAHGSFQDCFLSSYDWKLDKDGSILKGIMQGPLVVVQWISNHYYFSTVANNTLGGGSKITLNITGKHGAIQGNGSDLKMGLPLQSVMATDDSAYHKPIRLTTIIQAPSRFVEQILLADEKLKALLDNGWIHLMIMDPEKGDSIERYLPKSSLLSALKQQVA